jgi:hypothetical protein
VREAPAGEQVLRQQALADAIGARVADDPRPEAVAGIGRDHPAGLALPVQRERVIALALHPEVALEPLAEPAPTFPPRRHSVAPIEDLGDVGGADERRVQIRLHLDERDRRAGQSAVRVHHGVEAVLPALVGEPPRGATHISKVIVVAEAPRSRHPLERALKDGPQLERQRAVVRPLQIFGEEDHEERRRIDGAVVRDEGDLPARRQLAPAQLMEDLARLLVSEVVDLPALVRGEEAERPAGDLWLERQELERHDDAVAPERRHVPGDARVRDRALRRVGQQHVQIAAGSREPLVHVLVIRAICAVAAVCRSRPSRRRLMTSW